MAVESKPLFHPEVIRQQVRSFKLPERVQDVQPRLQHWAAVCVISRNPFSPVAARKAPPSPPPARP